MITIETDESSSSSDMESECVDIRSCNPCIIKGLLQKVATVFCKICNERLCDSCRRPHSIYKSGKHDIVSIQDMDSVPVVVDMKGMDMCQEHDEKIKFYCEDHSKLCCSTCVFTHRKCDNLLDLGSFSSQKGNQLHELKTSLIHIKSDIHSFVETCKLSHNNLNKSFTSIFTEIEEMSDRIIQIFKDAKQKLLTLASQIQSEENKISSEIYAVSPIIEEYIKESLPVCNIVLEHGTEVQKYIVAKHIEFKVHEMKRYINDKRNTLLSWNITLERTGELLSVLEQEKDIMSLKVEQKPTYADGCSEENKLDDVMPPFKITNVFSLSDDTGHRRKRKKLPSKKKKQFKATAKHNRWSSRLSSLANKYTLDSTNSNKAVLADDMTFSLKKADTVKSMTSSYSEPAFLETSTAVVVTPEQSDSETQESNVLPIEPYSYTLELLESVDLTNNGDDRPYLTGLDFLKDGRLLGITGSTMKCVVLNDQLEPHGTPYTFKANPQDVVCFSDCTLAVTVANKCVYLLTVSPDNVISLIRSINTSCQFLSICYMPPSNMVVCTIDNHSPVRMMSVDGVESDFNHVVISSKMYKPYDSKCTYVHTKNTLAVTNRIDHAVYLYDTTNYTSKKVTDVKIQGPFGVCPGPDDTLLVCCWNTGSIVHLAIDGTILGTFLVDMRNPYTLCITKDGTRLAVTNSGRGKRKLQLYKLSQK